MKLSSAIIENELAKNYKIVNSHCPDTSLSLKSPLYYCSAINNHPEDYRIYICDSETPQYSDKTKHCLFIYLFQPENVLEATNYIILDQQTSPNEVMNYLLITFERYGEWDRQLGNLNSEDQIQEILDISVPFFTNMLVLTDASFRVIAYSTYQPETGLSGPLGSIPTTTSERYEKLKAYYQQHIAENNCFIIPENILGFRKLACNLFFAGNNIGAITIHPILQSFRRQDAELLLYLCRRIEQSMDYLVGDVRLEGQLDRILKKMVADQQVTNEELELANYCSQIATGEKYRVIVFPIPTLKENEFVLYLRRRLSNSVSLSAFFEYDNKLYSLIHLPGGSQQSALIQKFEQMLDILAMHAGISDEFTKLENFSYYCKEACYAVCHGVGKDDSHLLFFHDYKQTYILEHTAGDLKREMLFPAGFTNLIAWDHQKKTNYLDTLETYLKEGMNGYKAAQKLFIHRNTLMARMAHIEQILNADLNDYDTRFMVELYIKLFKLTAT